MKTSALLASFLFALPLHAQDEQSFVDAPDSASVSEESASQDYGASGEYAQGYLAADSIVAGGDSSDTGSKSQTETCRIIDGITVCDNPYVPGEYTCRDFTSDFCKEANAQGVPAWEIGVSPYPPMENNFGLFSEIYAVLQNRLCHGHAVAAVKVEDLDSVHNKFCAVEPQNNQVYGCWHQEGDVPDMPSWIFDSINQAVAQPAGCPPLAYDEPLNGPSLPLDPDAPTYPGEFPVIF